MHIAKSLYYYQPFKNKQWIIICLSINLILQSLVWLCLLSIMLLEMNKFAHRTQRKGASVQYLNAVRNGIKFIDKVIWMEMTFVRNFHRLQFKFIKIKLRRIQLLLQYSQLSCLSKYQSQSLPMQSVYAFINNYAIIMVIRTVCLSIFIFPFARRMLIKVRKKFNLIIETDMFRYVIYLMLTVILLIITESLYTYFSLRAYYKKKKSFNPQQFSLKDLKQISNEQCQSYIVKLKQYNEFYMSQRNIMLTFSAIFIIFVFNRLLHNIYQYALVESKIRYIDSKMIAETESIQ